MSEQYKSVDSKQYNTIGYVDAESQALMQMSNKSSVWNNVCRHACRHHTNKWSSCLTPASGSSKTQYDWQQHHNNLNTSPTSQWNQSASAGIWVCWNLLCVTEAAFSYSNETAKEGHDGVGGFLLIVHHLLNVHADICCCANRDLISCHCSEGRCIYVRKPICLWRSGWI